MVEEIVVTGSRTVRDGSRAPTPVAVVAVEQLEALSSRNIVEGLQALPNLAGTTSTNTTRATAASNFVGSFLNLRGLGPSRTLLLLDGRRMSPSGTDGAADFNMVPQGLIKRIDVVTGGASAQYGSDAVAGVVNVILDTEFTGVKGVIQGGISDRGDVGNYRFTISGGQRYFDERLHLLGSYTNARTNELKSFLNRDWARDNGGGDVRLTTTVPASPLRMRDGRGVLVSNYPGGMIPWAGNTQAVRNAFGIVQHTATTPGQYYKFLPGGVGSPYSTGQLISGGVQIGGDGFFDPKGISALMDQETLFGRATYAVTDDLSIFAEYAHGDVQNHYYIANNATTISSHTSPGPIFSVFEGNPYLPADAAARLASTPLQAAGTGCNDTAVALRCFRMSRGEFPSIEANLQSKYSNLVTGFNATIFGDYRLSGYWQHGENDVLLTTENNQWFERVFAAADAVTDPATGRPACNILLTGTAEQRARFAGCVPMNLFGVGSLTPEMKGWLETDPKTRWVLKQDVYALDFAGEPFSFPAGPVGFAFGVERRKVETVLTGNPEADAVVGANGVRGFPATYEGRVGTYRYTNQPSYQGELTVNEAYTELNLPLLQDMFLAEDLSLNGAYRYTDYSLSGPVRSWKVGLSYNPIESVRFRATVSRDIRQPSPSELFQGSAGSGETIDDLLVPANGQYQVRTVRGGNPNLVPETADTYVVGVVFTPTWIPGLTASIDYYNISIEDAIQSSRGQIVILTCFQGVQSSCDLITRDGAGYIQTVDAPYLNLAVYDVNGTDLEISYRRSFEAIPGLFSIRTLMSYLGKKELASPGAPTIDYAGEVARSPAPRFRALTSLNWENGRVGAGLQHRYIGSGRADILLQEGVDIDHNIVSSQSVFDLNARYRFGNEDEHEAFLTINNVLDKEPPSNTNEFLAYVTRQDLYEAVGRSYVTGLRFRF